MKKTCLIVDDVEISRFAIQILLNDLGVASVEAGTSEECLAALAKQTPDLIMLDMHLGRESGIELLKNIRLTVNGSHIPVIVYSGVESTEMDRSDWPDGVAAFLMKPISEDKLKTELKKLHLV